MFHSDRVGQPHSRDIDWKVAGLNGLGLAFFFVPGIVAFAVDFYTGAIYLPPESYGEVPEYHPNEPTPPMGLTQGEPPPAPPRPASSPDPSSLRSAEQQPQPEPRSLGASTFRRITIPKADMNQQEIARVVTQQIGKSVTLSDTRVRVSPLSDLDQFATAYRQHRADPIFGWSPQQFFERLPTV